MTSATANPVRDQILYDAIRKVGGGVTFESAVAALPPDFDLDEGEYSTAIQILNMAPHHAPMIETTPAGTPLAQEPVETAETKFPNDFGGTIVHGTPAKRTGGLPIDPPMTQQRAADAVQAAENNLGEARMKLRHRQAETKAARAALATQITIWQTGLPVYTSDMNVRAHLKASQEARRERIAGLGSQAGQSPGGKSYIDRAAKYGRDHSPEGAARSRMQNGARRGAFGISQKFQKNFDPARGAVAKLPSER